MTTRERRRKGASEDRIAFWTSLTEPKHGLSSVVSLTSYETIIIWCLLHSKSTDTNMRQKTARKKHETSQRIRHTEIHQGSIPYFLQFVPGPASIARNDVCLRIKQTLLDHTSCAETAVSGLFSGSGESIASAKEPATPSELPLRTRNLTLINHIHIFKTHRHESLDDSETMSDCGR